METTLQQPLILRPSRAAPTRHLMSYDDYVTWANGKTTITEWAPVNTEGQGEVIVQMPTKWTHQEVVRFLAELLSAFVRFFNFGKVGIAPYEMKLKPRGAAREPDVLFVATANLHRLTNERLNGPADLVIEVISDDSVKRDRADKYREYQDAGVREYWIIDPRAGHQRADFYTLDDTGQYRLFATEEDERVESTVLPGFWLHPTWLWQASDLNPLHLFFEIAGLPTAAIAQIQAQVQTAYKERTTPNEPTD